MEYRYGRRKKRFIESLFPTKNVSITVVSAGTGGAKTGLILFSAPFSSSLFSGTKTLDGALE